MKKILIGLIAILIPLVALSGCLESNREGVKDNPIVVDICEIRDRYPELQGKFVIVYGNISTTNSTLYFMKSYNESCGNEVSFYYRGLEELNGMETHILGRVTALKGLDGRKYIHLTRVEIIE